MGVWDTYYNRISVHGDTKREAAKKREIRLLEERIKDSLSFHSVLIDGEERQVSIANSDNLDEKTMFSMPGEDIKCGGLVEWANNKWLITEKDANNELYTKVKLMQCNYLLRWVDDFGEVREQWCVIEDGTKYMTGELEDRNFVITRGDSRVAMRIARNEHTIQFGRERRFIIDDPYSCDKLAYSLTKPLKVGWYHNNEGIYLFVLSETATTEDDDLEMGIADYYKYFPRNPEMNPEYNLHICGEVCAASDLLDEKINDRSYEAIEAGEEPPFDETPPNTPERKKVWI